MALMTPFPLVPVFDIGRVLIQWQPETSLKRFFATDAETQAFMDEIKFHDWHMEQDRGRSVSDAVAAAQQQFPHHGEVFHRFYDDWLLSIPGAVEGTHHLFETLADQGPVYGISNFSRELFDRTVPHFPFLTRFTGLVISADEKLVKPDPAIFQLFCARYGFSAEQCLFIDDSLPNIVSARALGMTAIHFTDASALSSELSRLGFRLG